MLFVLSILFGLVCFLVGIFFAYKIMLPFMLQFLIGIGADTDISASITVQNYISFLLTMFLIFGAVFELPVLSVVLTQLDLVKVAWMKKGRRVVIVLIFLMAAVITPPDVVSQIMVAIPMMILYEFSILLCSALKRFSRLFGGKKREDEEDKEEETEEDRP